MPIADATCTAGALARGWHRVEAWLSSPSDARQALGLADIGEDERYLGAVDERSLLGPYRLQKPARNRDALVRVLRRRVEAAYARLGGEQPALVVFVLICRAAVYLGDVASLVVGISGASEKHARHERHDICSVEVKQQKWHDAGIRESPLHTGHGWKEDTQHADQEAAGNRESHGLRQGRRQAFVERGGR